MSPVSSYRTLFSLSGGGYVVGSFLARLPLAMSQLGVLLLVSDLTGSYGAGGASAGAIAVSNGLLAPSWGALADRIGQRPVLAAQSIGGAIGFLGILAIAQTDLHWGWIAVMAALTGVMLPQVGPMSRVRWRPLTKKQPSQERLVQTAFSFEGAADEGAFVIGPALVGVAVSIASPTAAIIGAAVLLATFGTWFALHPFAVPAHPRTADSATTGSRFSPELIALCASQLIIGTTFGSIQTGTTVLATDAGHPGWAGYLHALLGVGSVIAGLAVAGLPDRFGLPDRLRWFAVGLAVFALPLLLVDSLAVLIPVLLIFGISIAPYMITTFTMGERITPPWRLGTVMTQLAAATVLGYALGAAVAGQLADRGGHTWAYAVTVAATFLAVVVSWSSRNRLTRAQQDAAAQA